MGGAWFIAVGRYSGEDGVRRRNPAETKPTVAENKMPGCVLRASGATFKVDQFLEESSLSPCAVFRKGEKEYQASKTRIKRSGFNVVVSKASGDKVEKQFKDAIAFLKRNKEEVKRLKETAGVETVVIDFGVDLRVGYDDCFWPGSRLPEELIRAAGNLGLDIDFSFSPDVNPKYLSRMKDGA